MNQKDIVQSEHLNRSRVVAIAAGILIGWLAAPAAHAAAQATPPVQVGTPAAATQTGSSAAPQQAPAGPEGPQSPRAQAAPNASPSARTPPRPQLARTLALGGSAVALLAMAALLLPGRLRWLIVGEDNRYSTSKFQMLLWSWCVLTVYVAAVVLRWVDVGVGAAAGISIPMSLLALSGMSTLTFAGAKYITVSRIEQSDGEGTKAAPLSGPRFPRDLVNDDSGHRPDIGDTQMVVITVIAVAMYIVSANYWLGTLSPAAGAAMPDVDGTLLGALGVGQGAYLAKKYAGDAAPSAAGPVLPAPMARPVRPVR